MATNETPSPPFPFGWGRVLDNGTATFRYDEVNYFAAAALYGMAEVERSELITDLTSGSVWDIVVYDGNYYDVGWDGEYTCLAYGGPPGSSTHCTHGSVNLNNVAPNVPGGTFSETERRSLACEEMGHSVVA